MEQLLGNTPEVIFTTDWEGPLDGNTIDQHSLAGFGLFPWQIAPPTPWWSRPLKKGEIGCSISHWRCWKDALERNVSIALFLEDDVLFIDGYREKVSTAIGVLDRQHASW